MLLRENQGTEQTNQGTEGVYGRYVGDVFYDPLLKDKDEIFLGGRFLNQVLLDAGLARAAFWG